MKTIKAIETVYNNIKYRSRNEARWSVFLDCLGIDFEYEPEGYEIKNGDQAIKYLPDFFISKQSMFGCDLYIEIKPSDTDLIILNYDEKKVEAFAAHKQITVLGSVHDYLNEISGSGLPCGNKYFCYFPNSDHHTDVNDIELTCLGDCGYLFCQCIHCGCFGFEYSGRSERINCCEKNNGHKDYNYDAEIILSALRQAIEFRFWK
jgi:hypothetical protein